jgi:iron complex transport system permease protein
LILLVRDELDLLSLGESSARFIGLDLTKIRFITFAAISLLVAATVSTIGSIAFLGLASAHIARIFVGPRQRRLLLAASLISASILLLADTFARRAFFPQEIAIGFVIALISAPILIWALRNQRVWQER